MGGDDAQGLVEYPDNALALDVHQGKIAHAELAQEGLLSAVYVIDSDHADVLRLDLGSEAGAAHELLGTIAQGDGHGHAVDIPAGTRLGGVRIGMVVEPEQPRAARPFRHPGNAADGGAVVPAQDHGDTPLLQGGMYERREPFRDLGDGPQTPVATPRVAIQRLRGRNIAVIPARDAIIVERAYEVGIADGGRPHVHPQPPGPQIERHPEDSDIPVHTAPFGIHTTKDERRPLRQGRIPLS